MDGQDNVTHVFNGVLFTWKEECDEVTAGEETETIMLSKPDSERHMQCVFVHAKSRFKKKK